MRIVQIEDFFLPNAGYQINILSKYFAKQGHDVTIIAGTLDKMPSYLTSFFGKDGVEADDAKYTNETGVKIIRLPVIACISGRAIFGKKLERTVENLKPDVLYIHDSDTWVGIKYILKAHKLDYPLVYDNHMLEMASVNPLAKQYRWFYKTFVTPKIIKHKLKIIRIQDDEYVNKCLGIPLSQCPFISVGSDTLLFKPDQKVRMDFRKEHNIPLENFVVVYTGKIDKFKGGKLLAEAFRKEFINNKNKKTTLLVVGNSSGEYGNEVEEVFSQSENQILRFPTQKYVDLPQFYQAADLSVFPKQCSLSFYDAQACGLPVVSEDNSVNVDRLKFGNGFNFQSDNVDDFRGKITRFIEMEENEIAEISANAYNLVKKHYNYEDIAKQYLDIIEEEVSNFRKRSVPR